MNSTLNYYDENARDYFDNTVDADMNDCRQRFLKYLKEGANILDVGCGSGRDSKAFLSLGYKVKAIDGSKELCRLASKYLGQEVENIRFDKIVYEGEFDGIWACASLLHEDKNEIADVVGRLRRALKDKGFIYASFKQGEGDRMQGERYFNDLDEESLRELFRDFEIRELWFSDDVRPGRTDRWINMIGEKI